LAFPQLGYELNRSDWFASLSNGSEIWFGGLDDAQRVEKILGNEYSTIFLNECTQIGWDARNMVLSRLAEKSGLKLRMFYDCNPASVKHWTYTAFKQGMTPDGERIPDFENYSSLQMNPKDNLENLPEEYLALLASLPARQRKRFLDGEFQADVEGALWNMLMLEQAKSLPETELKKTIIAVDPAVTNKEDSDTTGIIVCGLDVNNAGVVLDDLSRKASPNTWAQRIVNAYHAHQAAYVVAEVNQGGDLVEAMIKNIDKNVPVRKVRASQGKFARAEPVAALYERQQVRHAKAMPELETELCEYVPQNSKKSPDRLDALVWGLTDLVLGYKPESLIVKPVQIASGVFTR
jgi:phage terminase large subunit-like protein